MVAEIDDICRQHPNEVVAVVSHADPIKTAIAYYIGLDLNQFQRLAISPTSVSALAIGEHGTALLVMNHSGDLRDMAKPAPSASSVAFIRRMAGGRT